MRFRDHRPGANDGSAFADAADEAPRPNPTAKWGLTLTLGNIKLAILRNLQGPLFHHRDKGDK